MILISQNRGCIAPFNMIWMESYCSSPKWGIYMANNTDESTLMLGKYTTEKNAKEVIKDIINALQFHDDIFYMPTEDNKGNLKYEDLYDNNN